MAFDFQQFAKENVPLLACYGAAVAAVVVQVVVVMPMSASGAAGGRGRGRPSGGGKTAGVSSFGEGVAKIRSTKNELAGLVTLVTESKLMTSADKAKFEERKAQLESQIDGLRDLYVEKDTKLEHWFTELNLEVPSLEKGRLPDRGQFFEIYKSKFEKLKAEYAALFPKVEGPVVPGAPTPGLIYVQPPETADGMIQAQKSFWIKSDLLAIFKAAGVKLVLSDVAVIPPAGGPIKEGETRDFNAYDVNVTLAIPFPEIPKLLRGILASELTYRLVNLAVDKREFGYDLKAPGRLQVNDATQAKYFAQPFYLIKFPEDVTEFKDEEDKLIPEPPVRVSLNLQALDFLFEKKAEAPKPSGEGE